MTRAARLTRSISLSSGTQYLTDLLPISDKRKAFHSQLQPSLQGCGLLAIKQQLALVGWKMLQRKVKTSWFLVPGF